MTIKLTKEHFLELIEKGFNLDYVFLLMLVKEGHDLEVLTKDNIKLDGMRLSLIRKALITEDNKLSTLGQELLDFMASKIASPIVKKQASTKEFDEWWESYPGTDHFEYKGRVFTGSRGMRVQKEKCKLKFNAIINEGVYSARQIIDATKFVVILKKENSFKKKTNELTYLQNSFTFLDKDHYVPFIDMMKSGVPIENSQPIGGGTDI